MTKKTDNPESERQAQEAHRKLKATEERAQEKLDQAAADLREVTEEQEAAEERLRKEARKNLPGSA